VIRLMTVASIALLVLVCFELYNGVHRVKAQEQQIAALKTQIAREAEAIRVLKAEWSYLNQPERLQALSRRHLALAPTGASQIVVLTSLPIRGVGVEAPSASPVIEAEDLPSRVVTGVPMPRPKPAPSKVEP
jgi:hypothetical protein